MGTSKGYDLPQGGDWRDLKNDASNFLQYLGAASISAPQLLRSYIHANGGPSDIAHRPGGAATRIGGNLARFVSGVSAAGLDTALRETGLETLVGSPAAEISGGLLEALAGPASTLDDHAARQALNDVLDELLKNTETPAQVEAAFSALQDLQRLYEILTKFFGSYLYRLFCRDFYEQWIGKVGSAEAARALDSVKDYIKSAVRSKLAGRALIQIDWMTDEARRIMEDVLQDVLKIFQVTT